MGKVFQTSNPRRRKRRSGDADNSGIEPQKTIGRVTPQMVIDWFKEEPTPAARRYIQVKGTS